MYILWVTFIFVNLIALFSSNYTAALKCCFPGHPALVFDLKMHGNLVVNGCHLVCNASWSHLWCYFLPSRSHWLRNCSGAWLIGAATAKSWINSAGLWMLQSFVIQYSLCSGFPLTIGHWVVCICSTIKKAFCWKSTRHRDDGLYSPVQTLDVSVG